jgi:K+-sensing histidine kinase KdpD
VGELEGYGTVWYHPEGIANILSLARMEENGYHISYDSKAGNEFIVKKDNGSTHIFRPSQRGLYYMDTAMTGTVLINTVADNKARYTNREYSRAVLARELQQNIG